MNVWLTTRDPAVAEAIANLQQYRHDYYGDIPVVAHAAGVTGDRPELTRFYKFPPFFHRQARAAWLGLYAGSPSGIPAYCDDLAWEYRAATAQALKTGGFPESTALRAAVTLLSQMACMEFFCDDAPWRYGFYGFDLQGPVKFLGPEGRLSLYQSAGKSKTFLYGGRGIEFAWVGAGTLPLLARDPAAWEREWRKKHAQDGVIEDETAGLAGDAAGGLLFEMRTVAHSAIEGAARAGDEGEGGVHVGLEGGDALGGVEVEEVGRIVAGDEEGEAAFELEADVAGRQGVAAGAQAQGLGTLQAIAVGEEGALQGAVGGGAGGQRGE